MNKRKKNTRNCILYLQQNCSFSEYLQKQNDVNKIYIYLSNQHNLCVCVYVHVRTCACIFSNYHTITRHESEKVQYIQYFTGSYTQFLKNTQINNHILFNNTLFKKHIVHLIFTITTHTHHINSNSGDYNSFKSETNVLYCLSKNLQFTAQKMYNFTFNSTLAAFMMSL